METKDKNQVVFYYNRQRRLENASPAARFAIDHHSVKRPGIVRSLTATRSLRYLFFALILIVVAVFVVGYAQGERGTGRIAGSNLSVAAMWFEGQVFVTVKRSAPWYLGKNAAPQSRPAIEIRTGDGAGYAAGILQSVDEELRLRFEAEQKPARVAVIASVPAADGSAAATLELVAGVE